MDVKEKTTLEDFEGMSREELDKVAYHSIRAGVEIPAYASLESKVRLYGRLVDRIGADRLFERREKETEAYIMALREAQKNESEGNLEEALNNYKLAGELDTESNFVPIARGYFFLKLAKIAFQLGKEGEVSELFDRAIVKPEETSEFHYGFIDNIGGAGWSLNHASDLASYYNDLSKAAEEMGLINLVPELKKKADFVLCLGMTTAKHLFEEGNQIDMGRRGLYLTKKVNGESLRDMWIRYFSDGIIKRSKGILESKEEGFDKSWIVKLALKTAEEYSSEDVPFFTQWIERSSKRRWFKKIF